MQKYNHSNQVLVYINNIFIFAGTHLKKHVHYKLQIIIFKHSSSCFCLFVCFSPSRPPPWIPLPCLLPSLLQLQTRTMWRGTASGPASVPRWLPSARLASASSWTAATAARPAPGRSGRSATRPTPATFTRGCTVTTARTSLGTKKECVHVSVTRWNNHLVFTQQEQLSSHFQIVCYFVKKRLTLFM